MTRDFPDHMVDMICADLPYSTNYKHHHRHLAWNQPVDLAALWVQFRRITKPHRPIVLFAIQPFTTDLVVSARDMFKFELVWVKNRPADFIHANNRPMRNHESILVFSAGKISPASRSNRRMPYYGREIAEDDRYPRSVIDDIPDDPAASVIADVADAPSDHNRHSMQKPVALLRLLIKMFSRPGEVVLDPTMGSGTTGVAALEEGRSFVGIEWHPPFFDIARERIASMRSTI